MTCDAVKTMELQDSFSALFLDVEAQIPTLRFTVETKGRGGGTVNSEEHGGCLSERERGGRKIGLPPQADLDLDSSSLMRSPSFPISKLGSPATLMAVRVLRSVSHDVRVSTPKHVCNALSSVTSQHCVLVSLLSLTVTQHTDGFYGYHC